MALVDEDWSRVQRTVRVETPMQALMEGLPYDEPQTTVVARQLLREALADCIEKLSDQDRYLLDARHAEQITIRALALRIGLHKSHTHRLCRRAELRLASVCLEHPVIRERLAV